MKNIVKFLLIIVLATTVFAESEDVFETCSHAVKFGKNYFESKYPIYIKNDNIYIPLRYFCDTIGIPIEWDNINKEVNVDIFDKKVNVSSKTKCIDAGIIPDEATAMAVGKAILEKHVGKTLEYEVDFVAENVNEIKYYQVSQSIKDEKVRMRELRSLESISDNYEKTILTMDKTINNDFNGIKVVNIIDFLLEE